MLLDDIDNGNKVDSESEEDAPATFFLEPIVACLYDLECNNPVDDNDEWVINENVPFDIFCALMMYLIRPILVPYTCLYPY